MASLASRFYLARSARVLFQRVAPLRVSPLLSVHRFSFSSKPLELAHSHFRKSVASFTQLGDLLNYAEKQPFGWLSLQCLSALAFQMMELTQAEKVMSRANRKEEEAVRLLERCTRVAERVQRRHVFLETEDSQKSLSVALAKIQLARQEIQERSPAWLVQLQEHEAELKAENIPETELQKKLREFQQREEYRLTTDEAKTQSTLEQVRALQKQPQYQDQDAICAVPRTLLQ
eukprot:TRINITY_DN1232_c0_g1_i1.p1 TRINITY_DN1232_c0_g1~~TRINITY_DN1232_c0_g1_i1.p1  ORF type:complete len:232 (+),score=78.52 TRINITY_DN1232_c0_g1_i1:61-756(+)